MPFEPDPLRDKFSRGARQLLDRAYAHPGTWQRTRLANPGAAAMSFALTLGINPLAPDNVSAQGGRRGGLNARTRWMRAFIRALYEQHLWWAGSHAEAGAWRDERRLVAFRSQGLRVDVGRAVPGLGVIPAGREVKVMVTSQGRSAAFSAAARMPGDDRIYADDRDLGARWSDPGRRDW
jgi:hypothetical protein